MKRFVFIFLSVLVLMGCTPSTEDVTRSVPAVEQEEVVEETIEETVEETEEPSVEVTVPHGYLVEGAYLLEVESGYFKSSELHVSASEGLSFFLTTINPDRDITLVGALDDSVGPDPYDYKDQYGKFHKTSAVAMLVNQRGQRYILLCYYFEEEGVNYVFVDEPIKTELTKLAELPAYEQGHEGRALPYPLTEYKINN